MAHLIPTGEATSLLPLAPTEMSTRLNCFGFVSFPLLPSPPLWLSNDGRVCAPVLQHYDAGNAPYSLFFLTK